MFGHFYLLPFCSETFKPIVDIQPPLQKRLHFPCQQRHVLLKDIDKHSLGYRSCNYDRRYLDQYVETEAHKLH